MLDTSVLDARFKKLFQDGKLVQVHVSKWGMSQQLTETDLALDQKVQKSTTVVAGTEQAPDVVPVKVADFIQLGKKYLFTPEVRLKFGRIESQARRFLSDNSHRFPIADAHFVPQKKLIEVLAKLYEFKEQYDKATAAFITNYGQHKEEMRLKHPDHWASLEPHYPNVQDLGKRFQFDVIAYEVAFPSRLKTLSMADITAQNIAVEQAMKKYESQMEEQYKHSIKEMEMFVGESAKALRAEVVKVFDTIAAKIRNKEVVSATNLKTVKELIDNFHGLDFFNDTKVKARLAEVKKLVGSGADFKTDEEALERLSAAVAVTLEAAKNMTDIDELTGGYIRRLDIGEL